MHDFVKDVNARQWWGIGIAITTLLAVVGSLAIMLFKILPATQAMAAVVK